MSLWVTGFLLEFRTQLVFKPEVVKFAGLYLLGVLNFICCFWYTTSCDGMSSSAEHFLPNFDN
jgi:hypothetical protein